MRSKRVQDLIDDMNDRAMEGGYSDREEGNSWLHFFLQRIGEYRGYRVHEKEDGTEWCETL